MTTRDNRHKLAAPYWARPGLRTVTDPDDGGGNDDDLDDDEGDDDEGDDDDDPDEGKSEAELRAELKAMRTSLEKANASSAKRRRREAALKAELAKRGASGDDDGDDNARKVDAAALQRAADERVAKVAARAELRSLGLEEGKLARALRLIDLSDVVVEGDDVDGLDDAIDALRDEVPELFAKPTRRRRQVSGDGDREGKSAPKSRSASEQQAAALLGRK